MMTPETTPIPPEQGMMIEEGKVKECLAFVDLTNPEIRGLLETTLENINKFAACAKELEGDSIGLAYYDLSIKYPEIRPCAVVLSGFGNSFGDFSIELETVLKDGILGGSLGRYFKGRPVGSQELRDVFTRKIYNNFIWRKYDQVLIALETLKCLDYIVELNYDDRQKYQDKWKSIENNLSQANHILSGMGINPVKITFFSKVDEKTAPFVRYTSVRPKVKEFYPNSSVVDEPEYILGATSWAYLQPDGSLWQGHRAELIVSK